MRTRPLLAGVLIAVALLAATACSNDSDVATSSSTTTKAPSSTTAEGGSTGNSISPPSSDGVTETSTDRRSFAESIDGLNKDLDAAKGDVCKLFALFDSTSTVEDPTDKAESKQAIEYVVRLLKAVADAAPASLSSEADAIRTTADKVQQEAAAADFDPAFLSSDQFKAFDDAAFNTAMQKFSQEATSGCVPPTTG